MTRPPLCSICRTDDYHTRDCTVFAPAKVCEGCRQDPAVQEDRWGDPICQACVDRMTAVGRKP